MNYWFWNDPTMCSLSEPSRKLPYILTDERAWNLLSNATVCASRFGWVLLAKRVYELYNVTFYHLYNPLTKEIISLPRFKWQRAQRHKYLWEKLATFSSVPTSPECVFIVVHVCNRKKSSSAHTQWGYKMEDTSAVILQCCYPEWRLLTERHWKECRVWTLVGWVSYFLAYGGHLYLVELRGFEFDLHIPECDIYKFDWLDRDWKKMESLEGGAIFLSEFPFGISAGEQTKMVANRVYYFSCQGCSPRFLIYGSEEKRLAGIGEKFESQDTIYYASPTGMGAKGRIWMEPPLLMP
ncbi:hypothetical protein AAG906_007402 [Vitis piasezkii]